MARPRGYADPSDISGILADEKSSANAVTAGTTQTIAGGTAITKRATRVTTVANSGDAVTLPLAYAGDRRTVMNKGGGNSLNVFPGVSTDKINALSAGAAYALASTKVVEFICAVDGTWDTLLTA
jgi:hypothetical protein